ncbi:hypothetical protein G3N95_20315 [Paraburkholderia sp. Tr-20389]|uniref:hypothetical protein n=1 Tax=Paraburkholderia sp. Tr-20389 TaxID=2703903 RepID=UPI00197CE87D|nr:hypothetical protein [Paraburkholderia sp. Tr-20389]MBN3755301.1 hypothetical protein [Paraburkholderia sp. Tr-20389]
MLFIAPARLYRDGIARLLRDFAPDWVVVDEAVVQRDDAGFDVLRDCARLPPVVVLVDQS